MKDELQAKFVSAALSQINLQKRGDSVDISDFERVLQKGESIDTEFKS